MTLEDAKQQLRENWESGIKCPCCKQFVKLYKRKLPYAAVIGLIAIYKAPKDEDGYVFFPGLQSKLKGTAAQGGYGTLGHFWGLIEHRPGSRDDGSNRVGWWRLTDKGRRFVLGATTVPQYAMIYNGELFGLRAPEITVMEALGNKFDYRELMKEA